jgi:hypothetical protein
VSWPPCTWGLQIRGMYSMLIGRDYRKALSQGVAFAVFRLIAIWLLVGAAVSYGEPVGHVGATVIIAVDIIAYSSFKGLSFAAEDHQREQWMNTLTNRFFYKLIWEDIQEGRARDVDVDELFKRATQETRADIQKADEDSIGVFDSWTWHWFGGVLSFLGQVIGYGVYYGSAFWVFAKQ